WSRASCRNLGLLQNTCVVNQNVQPAVPFRQVIVSLLMILRIDYVKPQIFRSDAFVAKLCSCGLAFFRIARPENDNDALLAELSGGLQTKTAIRASYECYFSILLCVFHLCSFICFCFRNLMMVLQTCAKPPSTNNSIPVM